MFPTRAQDPGRAMQTNKVLFKICGPTVFQNVSKNCPKGIQIKKLISAANKSFRRPQYTYLLRLSAWTSSDLLSQSSPPPSSRPSILIVKDKKVTTKGRNRFGGLSSKKFYGEKESLEGAWPSHMEVMQKGGRKNFADDAANQRAL